MDVAGRLDMTSFRNSIGPRRRAGVRTAADYGFTVQVFREGWAILREADGGWEMGLRIDGEQDGVLQLCFYDKAMNGGSYRIQHALAVRLDGDGYYRAFRGEETSLPPCQGHPTS